MTAKRLKDKVAGLDLKALLGGPQAEAPADADMKPRIPKTAPGLAMESAQDRRSELMRENDRLNRELQEWDGSKKTRMLDPKLVKPSSWANRDSRHFATADFAELKSEIANSGGNVQPIKVRESGKRDGTEFEIVYGHRRHQACLELGLPVLALIDNVGDQVLFVEMDRENRARKSLSAWEQGMMYRRALDAGLFPSNRKLAEAVGSDLTNVGKAIALARLPGDVIAAFESPLDLQFRWAGDLNAALERDPDGVKKTAQEIASASPRPPAKEVFERLIAEVGAGGSTVLPPFEPASVEIKSGGKRAAKVTMSDKGVASVAFAPGALSAQQFEQLTKMVEQLLSKKK